MAAKQTHKFDTSDVPRDGITENISEMVRAVKNMRSNHERRWHDNNFFDDGHHFRFVERTTNRIVDLSQRKDFGGPTRAIPKASRQIRGLANLLSSQEPQPVVFPEKISRSQYADDEEYKQAREIASLTAKRIGHWIEEEWKTQEMFEKFIHMIVLAAKHGVSFMQIWPDEQEEKIKTKVFDAFDIHLIGTLTEIYDSPFIIKTAPKLLNELMGNEGFDKDQRDKLMPDNRFAASDLKEIYMSRRYGRDSNPDIAQTVILREAFIKERINSENRKRIQQQKGSERILKGRKDGDVVIRHNFSTEGVWLKDEYLVMPEYPFVDFRFEPGPIYQVPHIERFIPANKSLDMVVSRLERFTHTMNVGLWVKRRGEPFSISNQAGGQVIEYDATPPTQANLANVPPYVFNLINLLTSFIEEQGVTTTTLGKLPSGVKSGTAIESLKESEFANLVIANKMVKKTIKTASLRMLDLAHNFFVTPQTVQILDKGEPEYFDIVGQVGIEAREAANIPVPDDVVVVKSDYKVDIEVQSGLGFTREGQIARAQQVSEFMFNLAQAGVIPKQAITVVVNEILKIFQFGSISEIMEAIEASPAEEDMSQEQLDKIKLALLQVIDDVQKTQGSPDQQQKQRVDETKLGAAQAIADVQQATQQGQAAASQTQT